MCIEGCLLSQEKDDPQNRIKIFANNVSEQGLVYRIYKEVLQLNKKKKQCDLKMGRVSEQTFL